jgi:hypothetical protein
MSARAAVARATARARAFAAGSEPDARAVLRLRCLDTKDSELHFAVVSAAMDFQPNRDQQKVAVRAVGRALIYVVCKKKLRENRPRQQRRDIPSAVARFQPKVGGGLKARTPV